MATTALAEHSLSVLGEFRPFGLSVEASDNGESFDTNSDSDSDFQYSIVDSEIFASTPEFSSLYSQNVEHELFIRGNHLIWSAGSQVLKRFTTSTPIIKVCWCRMKCSIEPLLCVLHVDSLTIYTASGEVQAVPIFPSTISIWPVPFGLLLQKASHDINSFSSGSSSCPSTAAGATDLGGIIRESSVVTTNSYLCPTNQWSSFEKPAEFTHYILMHTLVEPQPLFVDERGKASLVNDPEEYILWTSGDIPYIVSYNKGSKRHSIWYLKSFIQKEHETLMSPLENEILSGEPVNIYCISRIWQDTFVQTIANQVFLASDDDGAPIICFMFNAKKSLVALRLPCVEESQEGISKPVGISWILPAVLAVPVTVTRIKRFGMHERNQFDLLIMGPDNNLYLCVGRHRLCKFVLPLHSLQDRSIQDESGNCTPQLAAVEKNKWEIVRISDSTKCQVNVTVVSGKVFRCSLRSAPASALFGDCIEALAEGLSPSSFQFVLKSLWGQEFSLSSKDKDFHGDSDWLRFSALVQRFMCVLNPVESSVEEAKVNTSWEFLLSSKMHTDYFHNRCFPGISLPPPVGVLSYDLQMQVKVLPDVSNSHVFIKELFTHVLDILHAVYENYKLDVLHKRDLQRLVHLLSDLAVTLGEVNYVDYYSRDFPEIVPNLRPFNPKSVLRNPPNLMRWLHDCLKNGCNCTNREGLPQLLFKKRKTYSVDWSRKVVAFYGLLVNSERSGNCLSSGVTFNVASGTANSPEHWTVLSMVSEGFGSQQLDRLPYGVSLPLRHALDRCRESLPADWPPSAYVLVGREDLALKAIASSTSTKSHLKVESVLNHLNLLYTCSPYGLQLRPLNVPSSTAELHNITVSGMEKVETAADTVIDGMEHMFNSTTQLRFGRDLRLGEVRRLLCSATPVGISSSSGPVDEDQQGQLWHLTQRTTTLPLGRGAFTVASISTLLTEAVIIPSLDASGRVPSMNNLIVHLNIASGAVNDILSWPEFHNGVAAGLKIAPYQAKMSRTWIQYNKPEEPNFSHAGFLMALGLHGHLRVLTRSDIYEYLNQSHEPTMIGTMLGLASSHRGTMHSMTSKMLYVHIPARHPPTYPELELPTHVQSAAILSVGLLYQDTTHPMTMKVLLDEIGRRSGGGNVPEREHYAISAGLAFGLVTLGRGNDVSVFSEPVVEQLFNYITGGVELQNEPYSNTLDALIGNQAMDVVTVNVDVTAPAATVALALMFLKTECEFVAARIAVPDTHYGLQFVRPDFVLLRVVARNLILWSRVLPTENWIENQIPEIVKEGVKFVMNNTDDMLGSIDMEAVVQTYANIISGACFTIGLKFAGTENADAQELLYSYAVYFLNEIKPVAMSSSNCHPKGLAKYVDRATLETCLSVTILSLSLVMAGTGNLQTFRLLRYLHSRIDANGHVKYGNHLAVSMAIGFLFLGGGMCTFSTSKSAIAALLISLYPVFPTKPSDNNTHIQAFRHLYVLAVEQRCIQAVDVDTGCDAFVPLEITVKETSANSETTYCRVTPCILPERSVLKEVKVCGPRYWSQVIKLHPSDDPWWNPRDKNALFQEGMIYVKRKVGVCSYIDDPTGCRSLLSRVMYKVSDGSKGLLFGNAKGKSCKHRLYKIDQLVAAFSADPSLLAFARLCCDHSWNYGTQSEFQEFCVQLLLECVSTDRPALLQTYLYLYTTVASFADCLLRQQMTWGDTLAISNLKIVVAYLDALVDGKLHKPCEELLHSSFLGALGKRIEDIFFHWQQKRLDHSGRYMDFVNYMKNGTLAPTSENIQSNQVISLLLACYLKWHDIPSSAIVNSAMQKLQAGGTQTLVSSKYKTQIPLLALMLPGTQFYALSCVVESYPYSN